MKISDFSNKIFLFKNEIFAKKNAEVYRVGQETMIELSFYFKGQLSANSAVFKHGDVLQSGYLTIVYDPEARGSSRFVQNDKTEVFSILIDRVFFLEQIAHLIPKDIHFFAKSVENETPHHIKLKFNPKLLYITHLIQHSHYPDDLLESFLREKIIEIFIEVALDMRLKEKQFTFTKSDKEKLYFVRDLLEQHPEDMWSLKTIGKKAALNEFKLKKGFKELFGKSVFNYLLEQRLNLAYHTLSTTDSTVGETAFLAGYSNIHHFSKSFKKHFGFSPKTLKRSS